MASVGAHAVRRSAPRMITNPEIRIRQSTMRASMRLITSDLPGTGGLHKTVPEDFEVEEIPAYEPSGDGPHTYLWIQKRGLTTEEAVNKLCSALGTPRRDAGVAGQKDRQGVTRQWLSLPEVDPERALAVDIPSLKVLRAVRHRNKLRTGHLHGNKFRLVIRGCVAGALGHAQAIMDRLTQGGFPNYYGPQRFGAHGDNAARGKALLTTTGKRASGSQLRLLLSAYQSELFNRYLDGRIDDGLFGDILVGDVLQKVESGGLFAVADEAERVLALPRFAAGEVVPTGPMFGPKMKPPTPDSPAALREDQLLAAEGVPASAWQGGLTEGTRRALLVRPTEATVAAGDTDEVVLGFGLPSGSYATCILHEVMK